MREVQKRISELKPYVIQMGFSGDYIKVDVQFKPKWVLLDTETIKYTPNGDNKTYKFYASAETTEIDEILDLIERIITVNRERENKIKFLKIKADELKQLFSDKSLEELKRLEFVIREPEIVDEEDISFNELPDNTPVTIEPVETTTEEVTEDIPVTDAESEEAN